MAPSTGSRPGDPLADLMYGFVAARILDKVRAQLQDQQRSSDEEDVSQLMANSITLVDDMTFRIEATADQLVRQVANVAAAVIQVCAEHGMALSYGPNKTATILDFRGPGSTQADNSLSLRATHTHLPVITEHNGTVNIPIVQRYKHLGGYVTRNGGILQETKIRAAQAHAKVKPLQSILNSKQVNIEARRTLIRTMALPVLTLRSGTWFGMGLNEFRTWQSAVFKLYRTLHGRQDDGAVTHITQHEAANEMQAPMAMELLHIQKLRLLTHIMQEGDEHMFAAIVMNHQLAQEESWLAGGWRSVTWMQDQISSEFIHPEIWNLHNLETWSKMRPHAHAFKKLVRQAREAHLWRIRVHCEVVQSHRKQSQILTDLGWICPSDE